MKLILSYLKKQFLEGALACVALMQIENISRRELCPTSHQLGAKYELNKWAGSEKDI